VGKQRSGPISVDWEALEAVQLDFNRSQSAGKKLSLADLLVLAGCAGVEQAARN
jgi:catalase-peroxidase